MGVRLRQPVPGWLQEGRSCETGSGPGFELEDVQALAEEYSRTHSSRVQEEVVRAAWTWASRLARGVARHSGADPEVVHQVAGIGLCKALSRYDPSIGDFEVFARATVAGEVRHFLRSSVWPVHVSRTVQDRSRWTAMVRDELVQALGCEPTEAMVAEAAHLSVGDTALVMGLRRSGASLDERGAANLATEDHDLDMVPELVDLARALRMLGPGELRLLELRFFHGCTQEEIAALLGTNQVRVSRMLARTLASLRRLLSGG